MKTPSSTDARAHFLDYGRRLAQTLEQFDYGPLEQLAMELKDCWKNGRQVFLAGNGGSAGNAVHLANDFIYALSKIPGNGLRINALPANPSILTCLANDEGYEKIFSIQLAVQARPGDVLIVFSGSGNSPNILAALEEARRIGVRSYAVLGFSGGKAKALADVPIHVIVEDMQISEDTQLIFGHMLVQWLYQFRDQI